MIDRLPAGHGRLSIALTVLAFAATVLAQTPTQPGTAAAAASPAALDYNRQVRPILSENCFVCHGPDKNNRKAKLRLDIRDEALGRQAIVPGKPEESELVKRIDATDDGMMPPLKSHKKLAPADKETLKQWIAGGANYAAALGIHQTRPAGSPPHQGFDMGQ